MQPARQTVPMKLSHQHVEHELQEDAQLLTSTSEP